MNNLIFGKCADTFTDVNSTKEDVIGAWDLAMRSCYAPEKWQWH